MTKVNFAIIGVPKSATTFVHHALMSHPDVMMEEGENAVFNRINWQPSLTQLLERAEARGRRLCGVKRPDMLFNNATAEKMKSHNSDIKAIAVLRHPIERTVAHYFHLMKYSFLPLLDFATGIRKLFTGEMQQHWPRSHEVLDFSCYADAMTRYMEALGRTNVQFIIHDDVKKNATEVMRAVCAFLDLDFEGNVILPTGNPQKVMYSLERLRFLRHGNEATMELDEFDRAKRFRLQPLTDQESAWDRMIKQFDEKVMAVKLPNVPPRLDANTWEMLYTHFENDIARVESILGRTLPTWHSNPLS